MAKVEAAESFGDLTLVKGNPPMEEFLGLAAGTRVTLSAVAGTDAEKPDCDITWSVDGSGHFSTVNEDCTEYFPAEDDTRITVSISCCGEVEVLRQDVATK